MGEKTFLIPEVLWVPLAILFIVGSWYVFPYTVSRQDRYRTSPLDMVGKRIGSVIASTLIAFGVIGHISSGKDDKSTSGHEKQLKLEEGSRASPAENLIIGEGDFKKMTSQEEKPRSLPDPAPISISTAAMLPNAAKSKIVDPKKRIYTQEEIRRMEEERKYFGNDPIVRKRLGLPSRETGKIDY